MSVITKKIELAVKCDRCNKVAPLQMNGEWDIVQFINMLTQTKVFDQKAETDWKTYFDTRSDEIYSGLHVCDVGAEKIECAKTFNTKRARWKNLFNW